MGKYDEAEREGRLALDWEPLDTWAHHAMAHVLDESGSKAIPERKLNMTIKVPASSDIDCPKLLRFPSIFHMAVA